jgi:hypothetical protein
VHPGAGRVHGRHLSPGAELLCVVQYCTRYVVQSFLGLFFLRAPASDAISLASAVGIRPRRQMRSPDPRMTPGPNLAEAGTGGLQCVRCTPALSCRSAERVYRVGSAKGCEVR